MFISQLIRYARAYEWLTLRAVRLLCKLLGQGYVMDRLKSSLRKFFGRYWDLIKCYEAPSPKCYMTFWDMNIYSDTLYWSDISRNLDLVTELGLITVYDVITLFREVSIGHLQRVRLANRERLLLWTLGPILVWTCICSNVETFFPELVMSTNLLGFEHPLVLLVCFVIS